MEKYTLATPQKRAAAAMFALGLHQSQIYRTRSSSPLSSPDDEPTGEDMSSGRSVSVKDKDNSQFWIQENSALLLPILRFLRVDDQTWDRLKETAWNSSQVRHHVGVRKVMECQQKEDKKHALAKAVDDMMSSVEDHTVSSKETIRCQEYEIECHDKYAITETKSIFDLTTEPYEIAQNRNPMMSNEEKNLYEFGDATSYEPLEEGILLNYERKLKVLYELLSACVMINTEGEKQSFQLVKGYDARHRTVLRLLATWLGVKWEEMGQFVSWSCVLHCLWITFLLYEAMEIMVASFMMESVDEENAKEVENIASESPWGNWKQGGIIGAAAVTGGTIMAITGGLAAPAIAHGLGALAPTLGSIVHAIGANGFAAAASATGSVAGSAAVAASFGVAGAGLTGSKMARRIGSVDEFEFKETGENHNQGRLAVGILVSGLVFEDEDFIRPWEGQNDNLERAFTGVLTWLEAASSSPSKITLGLMKEGAKLTVLNGLLSALALPSTIVAAFDLIDSKWAIAVDRSDQAGEILAEVLLNGLHGNRPVTLIGFSLGARVIFKCLQCLAETGDKAGLVERAVLLGAPISINDEKWDDARQMVAGRFVNVYSSDDWTLGIAYRASLLSQGLAGIQPVNVPGIENVDVTDVIEGHSSYLWMTKQILEQLDLDSFNTIFSIATAKPHEEKSFIT